MLKKAGKTQWPETNYFIAMTNPNWEFGLNSPGDRSTGILAKWTGGLGSFHKCSTDFRSGLIGFPTSPTLCL